MTTKNELYWLIIRINDGDHIMSSIRVLVSDKDMEVVEPVLQRLMRGSNNPGLSFEVKQNGGRQW